MRLEGAMVRKRGSQNSSPLGGEVKDLCCVLCSLILVLLPDFPGGSSQEDVLEPYPGSLAFSRAARSFGSQRSDQVYFYTSL